MMFEFFIFFLGNAFCQWDAFSGLALPARIASQREMNHSSLAMLQYWWFTPAFAHVVINGHHEQYANQLGPFSGLSTRTHFSHQ
jgi:hypothetical protein